MHHNLLICLFFVCFFQGNNLNMALISEQLLSVICTYVDKHVHITIILVKHENYLSYKCIQIPPLHLLYQSISAIIRCTHFSWMCKHGLIIDMIQAYSYEVAYWYFHSNLSRGTEFMFAKEAKKSCLLTTAECAH